MDKPNRVSFVFFLVVIVNIAIGVIFFLRKSGPTDGEIATPTMAIDALESRSLYFTPAARSFLVERKPQLLAADDKDEKSERAIQFAQAAQDPKLWRELDHKYRFDTLLLSGDPGRYRPLLQHLAETRDWTLAYLDHTSFIFKRPPAKAWRPDDLAAIRNKFAGRPTVERVTFLVQAAAKLLAISQFTTAKHYLDEARGLNRKSPEVWTQFALYHVHFGQWAEALDDLNHALAADEKFAPALASKSQILFSMRRFDEALPVAEQLVKATPRDPASLFLRAKIAHEAHAYYIEIEALKELVALAEREHHPSAGYRIYLAQAYASDGEALLSLEQFQRAAAGELSAEQRKYVEESIEQIKTRAPLQTQSNR